MKKWLQKYSKKVQRVLIITKLVKDKTSYIQLLPFETLQHLLHFLYIPEESSEIKSDIIEYS